MNSGKFRLFSLIFAGVFVFCAVVAGIVIATPEQRAEASVVQTFTLNHPAGGTLTVNRTIGGNTPHAFTRSGNTITATGTSRFYVNRTGNNWTSSNIANNLSTVAVSGDFDLEARYRFHDDRFNVVGRRNRWTGQWQNVVRTQNDTISLSTYNVAGHVRWRRTDTNQEANSTSQTGAWHSNRTFSVPWSGNWTTMSVTRSLGSNGGQLGTVVVVSPVVTNRTMTFHLNPTSGGGSMTVAGTNATHGSTRTMAQGTAHSIVANAAAGWQFSNWQVIAGTATITNVNAASTTLTIAASNATIRANFTQIQRTMTFQLNPASGSGTMTVAGTNATHNSSRTLTQGTNHAIVAKPAFGWSFSHWDVAAGSATIANASVASTTFTVGAGNATIRANFSQQTHTVNFFTNPVSGGGTFTLGGTAAAHGGSRALVQGTVHNLVATAATHWTFSHWTVSGVGSSIANVNAASTTFTLGTATASITAHFRVNFGTPPPPPEPAPENWEFGWNILRLHFGSGNAASNPLPGFDVNENSPTATRFFDPTNAASRNLPTAAQMNAWATTQPGLEDRAFIGWYTNSNFETAEGKRVSQIPVGMTGVIRYYARWEDGRAIFRIASGGAHGQAIRNNGELLGWGFNPASGINSSISGTPFVTRIGTANNWAQISAFGDHTLAITTNGELWAWGNNGTGQLGDGTTGLRHTPMRIGTRTDWVQIAGGMHQSFAITASGELWAWGQNNHGQLGDGTTIDRHSPVRIGTRTDWAYVSSGGSGFNFSSRTMAITRGGELWSWGGDSWVPGGIPVRIGTASNWARVSVGTQHQMALTTNGELWAWGVNQFGQLGDGTTTNQPVPVRIGIRTDWAHISAGGISSHAITTGGELWAWGQNSNGRLGDGTTTDSHTPIRIGTRTDWLQVEGSQTHHTLAITRSGYLFAWGGSNLGQLGLGSPNNQTILTPTRVNT
ncbi:MAG: hypothetical protein FWE31_01535 [Firmicutes bacterium]|nr:hypothetical protein [Bacillota bacterium]